MKTIKNKTNLRLSSSSTRFLDDLPAFDLLFPKQPTPDDEEDLKTLKEFETLLNSK